MKTILLSNVNNDIAEHLFICVFDHRFAFEALPFDRWKKYDVFCKCKYRRYNISSGGGGDRSTNFSRIEFIASLPVDNYIEIGGCNYRSGKLLD